MLTELRTLFQRRLKVLGITQEDAAKRLDLHPTHLSKILNGHAPMPHEDAPRWCQALEITGSECQRLGDLMAIAAAPPRVSEIVNSLEVDIGRLAEWRTKCERRLERIRDVVNNLDLNTETPLPEPPQSPPPTDTPQQS